MNEIVKRINGRAFAMSYVLTKALESCMFVCLFACNGDELPSELHQRKIKFRKYLIRFVKP